MTIGFFIKIELQGYNIDLFEHFFPFQVKINGQSEEMLRAAAEQFGSKCEEEIAHGNNYV